MGDDIDFRFSHDGNNKGSNMSDTEDCYDGVGAGGDGMGRESGGERDDASVGAGGDGLGMGAEGTGGSRDESGDNTFVGGAVGDNVRGRADEVARAARLAARPKSRSRESRFKETSLESW
jgi:hypothetical protein